MIKLTESEKRERKLMRMFERHFINYSLDLTISEALEMYSNKETYLMFLAYQAGYLKGSTK
jgi:hypothetical protein